MSWQLLDPVWSPEWALLHYATFLRATLILILLAATAGLLHRLPASVRAGLWAAALLALLPLPELRALPVHWSAHVVPPVLAAPMVAIGATMVTQSSPAAVPFPWTSALGLVWMLGAALVIGQLICGWAALGLLASRARPVNDPAWLALLGDTSGALGVRRPVRLLRSSGIGVPLTWGTLRPAILLPAEADGWPDAHRRAVLLHELAHVSRLDCLLALGSRCACALWWFHPGAWWAAHRLDVERERACDERVLRAGVRPSDYAECLLRIAGSARGIRAMGPAVVAAGLVRRSQLRARLHAILNPAAPSRQVPRYVTPAVAITGVLVVVTTFGSMRLAPHPSVLWSALDSPQWQTRAYAAENIARFGNAGSLRMLEDELRDERHPSVPAMARFGEQLRARTPDPVTRFGWPRD
ncbi:hypothetical protein BH23GEM5_BH23GEM5_12890 [soil metagenome]